MPSIPLAEMELDLELTNKDLTNLEAIVKNLEEFMHNDPEEDRIRFKTDVMRFQALIVDATRLKTKIQSLIEAKKNE